MRRRTAAIGLAALLMLLPGCGDGAAPSGDSGLSDAQSEEQRAALEDGVVSEDEYQAGYRRFVSCLADKGYVVLDKGMSYGVIDYAVPEAAVLAGDDVTCYDAEYGLIDGKWQTDHEDSSYTAVVVKACLERAGIQPADSLDSMLTQLESAGITLDTCQQS